MAAAVIFSVASCAKEDISTTLGKGQVEVTFTANLADLSTRTIGDGMTVDQVYLAVYEKGGTKALESSKLSGTAVVNGKATINVVLLKDKTYDLVFWAQNNAANAYDITALADGRTIKANYAEVSNLENRDAFCLVRNNYKAGHDETTFSLKRPFAQINVANSDADVEYIKDNGAVIEESKMVVKTKVRNTLNMLKETPELAGELVDVTFESNAIPAEDFYKDGYNYLAMNYLLVNERELVDLEFVFTDDKDVNYTRKYFQVPVQRNYRTNILGQIISSPYDFNVEIVPGFDGEENPDISIVTFNDVDTDAELLTALTVSEDHVKHIIVNLTGDVTYDVNAWQACAMGGNNTKEIIINGSKSRSANADYFTLTFNHKNSDWNNIVTNGAKLVLNNLNLTNSGHGATNAPWNRHDLVFNCEVEMDNVVSLNAIALKANAKIENTTINDDHEGDSYAVWIQPNGQTVTINNCTIDSTGAGNGRGIKIDEQYVDAPKKVILNVAKTTFVTESKAAILVKSKAGAEISASELDITGVAADSQYAVWVDEDAAEYYNLVKVTGADVRLEGSEAPSTGLTLKDDLKTENAIVYIKAKEDGKPYDVEKNFSMAKGTKLIGVGEEPVAITNTWGSNAFAKQAHFTDTYVENIFFDNNLVIDAGIANGNVTFKNCVFGGKYGHQGVHFDSGNGVVVFENCTFIGRNMLGSSLEKVIFNNCTFLNKKSSLTGPDKWTGVNMWGKYEFNNCSFDTEAHCNVKCDGVVAAFNNCTYGEKDITELVQNNSNYDAEISFKVVISTVAAFEKAIEANHDNVTIVLADGTYEGTFIPRSKNLTIMSDGNATIKGRVNVDGYADGITFKNIKFDINDASKVKDSFPGANYKYPAIVVIYATAANFEGCEFKADIASGVCGINYGAHAANKPLTVNNCKFTGDFYAIRSRTLFSVTNNEFNIHYSEGTLAAIFTWGNGEAGTKNDGGANKVVFTGNKNVNANKIYGVQLSSTTFNYCHINYNIQGNTNFHALADSVNSKCDFTGKSFAAGSETF